MLPAAATEVSRIIGCVQSCSSVLRYYRVIENGEEEKLSKLVDVCQSYSKPNKLKLLLRHSALLSF